MKPIRIAENEREYFLHVPSKQSIIVA